MTRARVRGGTLRAAHPGFESALNVSDAPLRVTLGLGNAQTHRLPIKTCCLSILLWFYLTSEKCSDFCKKADKSLWKGAITQMRALL